MQEQQPPSSVDTKHAAVSPAQPGAHPSRNLYEPYITPGWFWIGLRTFIRFIFFLLLNIKLVGRKNIPQKGPYFIVSNHRSWTDVPLVPAYTPHKVIYMAKEELFHGSIGWLVRFLGAIPVKRGEADRQLLRASQDLLKRGKIMVIFPEGTRSKNHQLGRAYPGVGMMALRADVPVIPVAVCGSEYALKRFRPHVTISYGEPMYLKPKGSKITKDDVNEATEAIMRSIAAMLPESDRGIYGEISEGASETNKATE